MLISTAEEKKWHLSAKGVTKVCREFKMLLSHKVIFELGLKCCFMNMMKWPFKVFSEEPILQGLLRTHTAALYHPGRRREKRPKRNRKRAHRDSQQKGEHSETKMQRGAEMS